MTVIRDGRRTETPNAVMTTLASPTQGGSRQAVWRVEMAPGAVGPVHAFDTEQVWTILDGAAEITVDGVVEVAGKGETVVLPADLERQVRADARSGMVAIVCAPGSTRVYRTGVVPACATEDGDKILPDWIA
ncbi:cupin domain-containing protein [Amycolatopsis orientalis]|uniref:cupin domain-containing protein n=1 Tax=Amycolatopsis orientalis TaxID=31958 RepID=UPI0003A004E9|nr:cupin domain-containing protein [Amycolatopsis orientalis]